MGSLSVVMENINKLATKRNLLRYSDISEYLNVSESSIKQWESSSRTPTIKKLDYICDKLMIPTYILLQKDADLDANYNYTGNNSREIFIKNLEDIFMTNGCFSWRNKTALFFGFVSEDMLKSYFRKINYRVPPLKKLDEMAEALGIPTYQLIKEDCFNEKRNR